MTPIYYDYYQFASGKISRQELDSRLAKYRTNNYARDFADNVYHTRLLQQYNLALRNSSDVSSNNLVVNYKHDNAELINNDLDWLTAYYKGSFELAKWLKATVSVNGLYSDQKSLGYNANYRGSFDPWTLPAYMPFYNEDGSIRKTYYWFTGNEYWDVPNGFHDLGTDPVSELKNNVKTNTRQNMRYMAASSSVSSKDLPPTQCSAMRLITLRNRLMPTKRVLPLVSFAMLIPQLMLLAV